MHTDQTKTAAPAADKHTPGPWIVNTTTLSSAIVRWHVAGPKHGSIYPICEHMIEVEPSGSEQLANARLIAAAPELLEALKDASDYVHGGDRFDHFGSYSHSLLCERIRAAIAKAEGRS